jgi:acetylornithine deacetylase/succinyl-diaminopimelate desuccinylase-like protein
VTTDGTTLLGADDKAGVAVIMTVAEELLKNEMPHGKFCIGFTPDEEVGRGADEFDIAAFGAEFAYTVDGGGLGEIEYENFNAASGRLKIHGQSIHPGSAKGKMVNAILVGMEFQQMLPVFENPAYNEANNISSAMCARYLLKNAYVCEADLLVMNPNLIKKYQYSSNYLLHMNEQNDNSQYFLYVEYQQYFLILLCLLFLLI